VKTSRLEAFTDGVIAILITIMVLDLKIPHETTWEALTPLVLWPPGIRRRVHVPFSHRHRRDRLT